jgi:small-conductance mechanosensitive channel
MAKVCISIRDIDSIYCKFMAETRRDEVLEIRLDKCGFSEQEIKDVFSSQREAALLAAYPCRLATEREDAINALSTAILAGADLVDIETSLPEDSRRWLSSLAMNKFCKTISTVPPYALISDSFQNWRGMREAGGRRIKRHIPIDLNTIGYLTNEQRGDLVSRGWMKADAPADVVNLKVFRDYLQNYLRSHTQVHQELTLLVRELQPTSEGIPLELYFFSNTTVWAEYETIQSEVIEHVLSVMPKFGLRAFQRSSGSLSSLENPIKYS